MRENKSLFATIESEIFRQEAQIINNLAGLTHTVKSNKQVNAFYETYAPYPDKGASLLADRIKKLLAQPTNLKYLNKYDAAIAAYLYMLHKLSRSKSQSLMAALELPKNTWWSLQMLMVLKKKEDSKKTVYKYTDSYASAEGLHDDVNLDSRNSATANIKGVFA